MKDTTYILFYVFTSMFGVYVVKLFMNIFFSSEDVDKRKEFLTYAAYYVVPTVIYICMDVPILNLFMNIGFFLLITLNYKSTWKKRFLSIVLLLALFMCVESIVVTACGYAKFNMLEQAYYAPLLGQICSPILEFMIVQCLLKYRNLKKDVKIPGTYWLAIVFVPCVSFYIATKIFTCGAFHNIELLICSVLILGINLVIFGLYDRQIRFFEQEKQAQFLRAQNNLLENQIDLIKTSDSMARSMRHDWKNHVHTLCHLIDQEKYKEVKAYSEKIEESSGGMLNRANSGNLVIDSILNFKLYEASQIGADVTLDLETTDQINIEPFDLNVVFSNLLDNAIEAMRNVDEPKIFVRVKQKTGSFVLEINNSYSEDIVVRDDKLQTSKSNHEFHGIGLDNVRNVLKKYNGVIDIDYNDNTFHSLAIWNVSKNK